MRPHRQAIIPDKFVTSFNLNGLNGRMVCIPNAKKSRNMLFVYGHHSSLERIYGILEDVSQYGSVTAPDLPGFGGMDSLYAIDEEPSIDTLADYLAGFVKFHYKKQRFTVIGFSIGFAIVTRMLQKYPEIAAQIDDVFSFAGFTTHEDFKLSKGTQRFYKYGASFFCGKIRAWIFRHTALNALVLKSAYRYTPNARHKFKNMTKSEFNSMIQFEIELWHNNDVRTYMRTAVSMLTVDLTAWKVNLPMHHISVGVADQYFDNELVLINMKKIYKKCDVTVAELNNHAPSVIASKDESAPFMPPRIRKILNSKPKAVKK